MTSNDAAQVLPLIHQRLVQYGHFPVSLSAQTLGPQSWTYLDNKPVILYASHAEPNHIKVFDIDLSLTVGQFIDTFDVTMKVLNPDYDPAKAAVEPASPPVFASAGLNVGAYPHQIAGVYNPPAVPAEA